MKINYIISSTTSGATTKTLKQVAKKSESRAFDNFIVIVPETKSIAIERELLDLSKTGAFSNVFVYSFVRLLDRLGGIDESKIVSKQTCVMLLRQIILSNLDKLKCYQKAGNSAGFAEQIYDTIQQFKSSGVTVSELHNAINLVDEALKVKLEDICFVFEKYEEALSEELFDDCDKLNMLSDFAKTSEFLKESEIFIVGFDNVTTEMLSVLKEFAVNSREITFSCCYFNENRKDKYIQSNELYKKFVSIAENLKYPYVPYVYNPSFSGDFWNAQNYLFSTENKKVESKGNIKIFEFSNKQNEIEFVVNQIINEVNEGKRFRDIAIIDPELEADEELLKQVLTTYNIPFYLQKSYDVSGHFFVKFIKYAIEAIKNHLSQDSVLCWLSNAMIDVEGYDIFVNYVNEQGVDHNGFLKDIKDNKNIDENTAKIIENNLKIIKNFYNEFKELFSGQKKVSEFIEYVNKLYVKFNCEDKLNKIASYEREIGLIVESEVTLSVINKFKQINDNFSKFLGGLVVSATEFLMIYLSGFAQIEVNIEPVSIDSVVIHKNIDGLYNIKTLFAIGAVEGKFPSVIQNSGIILDEELSQTGNVVLKDIEPTTKQINKRENYKIYETILLPQERLYLSYSLKSVSGSSNKPARVVSRLINLFGLKVIKDYLKPEFVCVKSVEKKLAKEIGEYILLKNIEQSKINKNYNKIKNKLSNNFKRYLNDMIFGEKEFILSNAKDIFFYNNKTSISQLEQYFSCPYAFFAKYGLRLKEAKKAAISSPDIGTIIHRFAELFVQEISSLSDFNDEYFNKKVTEIFNKTIEELNINPSKNVSILKFIYDESLRLAKYLFEEQINTNFKNVHKLNEFKFKGDAAIEFVSDSGRIISLEGVIDRIDMFGNYIRIIDYKTGKIDNNLNAIYYGKKIQLISYLNAVTKIKNTKVAGLFYFPIHSDFVKIEQKIKNNYKMQGFLLDDIDVVKNMDINISFEKPESKYVPLKIKTSEKLKQTGEFEISHGNSNNYLSEKEFEIIKQYNKELCLTAINEILSGNIEPAPLQKLTDKNSAECAYCDFAGFCGKEHSRFGEGRKYLPSIDASSFDLSEVDDGN